MGSSAVELISNKQGHYLILTPAQSFEVDKRASEQCCCCT